MSASYVVYVLDATGAPVAMLDTTTLAKLKYERRLNGVGLCQFTLPLDDERASWIGKDTLVQVYRYPDPGTVQAEGSYIVRGRKRFVDSDGQRWAIFSGVSPEYLLLQRHINPNNDPLVAGGYSTKQAAVDTVMAELVEEQAGPTAAVIQRVPYLTVSTPAGIGETASVRLQWENLLETLRDLAGGYQMDFRIERVANSVALVFYAQRTGSDKSRTTNYPGAPYVLLSPELGRLVEPELEEDWRNEKTYVYLLGKGAGDARELYGALAGAVADTPYSFAALVEDARESDQIADYVTQARQALAKNRAKESFSFAMDRPELYRQLFDLGDTVTVEWEDYSGDMRITAVAVDVEGDHETIEPEVTKPYES